MRIRAPWDRKGSAPRPGHLCKDAQPFDAAIRRQRANTAHMNHLDLAAFEVGIAIYRRFPAGPEQDEWLAWVERARGRAPLSLPQRPLDRQARPNGPEGAVLEDLGPALTQPLAPLLYCERQSGGA